MLGTSWSLEPAMRGSADSHVRGFRSCDSRGQSRLRSVNEFIGRITVVVKFMRKTEGKAKSIFRRVNQTVAVREVVAKRKTAPIFRIGMN
jgi:hypothetical protein